MKWKLGRQNSGYYKFQLANNSLFDMWLINYPTGSNIPPHKDKIDGYKHYRINVIIRKPKSGGVFKCDNVKTFFNRIHVFRSDINEHSVSTIDEGNRLALSIGIFLKRKK